MKAAVGVFGESKSSFKLTNFREPKYHGGQAGVQEKIRICSYAKNSSCDEIKLIQTNRKVRILQRIYDKLAHLTKAMN